MILLHFYNITTLLLLLFFLLFFLFDLFVLSDLRFRQRRSDSRVSEEKKEHGEISSVQSSVHLPARPRGGPSQPLDSQSQPWGGGCMDERNFPPVFYR